jgi:phage tail-like protein
MSDPETVTGPLGPGSGAAGRLPAVTGPAAEREPGAARIDHVADHHLRYPGEVVTFYTRLTANEALSDLTIRISIPESLEPGDYRMPIERADSPPRVQVDSYGHYLVWTLAGDVTPGTRYEYQVEARLLPVARDLVLESEAVLSNSAFEILARESTAIDVRARGRYLQYLPELYERDEMMGRFLMLFESFWAPIVSQIEVVDCYLEPRTAPSRFLPWLASWLGLELDDRLAQDRQRELIRWAFWLYRRRGTRQALKKYLEIYTGGDVQIVEHRATDFRLGPESRLGFGIAMGTGNRPHSFSVSLRVPPLQSEDGDRRETGRRRMIEAIIEAEKPAHTDYTLHMEIVEGGGATS